MAFEWLKGWAGLNGYIDALDRYHVAGWAAYPGGVAPTLHIQVDGRTVDRVTPAYNRPDLAKLYPTNSRLGFYYIFANPLPEGALVAVTDERGKKLRNSPKPIPIEVEADLTDVTADLTTPVPPPELVFLVNGHRDRRQFAVSRRATVTNIIDLLSEAGIDYRRFRSILDFGCGCGRILAGWEGRLANDTALLGCDINPKLIEFCAANIPFARTFVSDFLPPLQQVAEAQADFVYAASVFTHLTLSAARAWAHELAKITAPGGILMMSFSDSYYRATLAGLSAEALPTFEQEGFYCYLHGAPNPVPCGANDYATFMTGAFAKTLFTGFELIMIVPGQTRGPNPFASFQDIAIFRRSSPRGAEIAGDRREPG